MKGNLIHLYTLLFLILCVSCNNGPKVIEAQTDYGETPSNSGIMSEENSFQQNGSFDDKSLSNNIHHIIVNEVQLTEKYAFAKVSEGENQYWIATRLKTLKPNGHYYYTKGLLKNNYESKELNKVFDRIYLVSNLVSADHKRNTDGSQSKDSTTIKESDPELDITEIAPEEGSIKIAEIVARPEDFKGKIVQITGKCVKVNPNIMERNWIHLKDGSKDDYDLVVTSGTFIKEGEIVTIRAKVSLNRDYGAGYTYPLILEDGEVIQ